MTEKEVIDIGLSVECDMCSRTYRSKDGTILVPETGESLADILGSSPSDW